MAHVPEIHQDGFVDLLFKPDTVRRALGVALLVGTILIAINQGDMVLAGEWPPIWKIILTYMVPYSVSSYSSAALMSDLAKQKRSPT